MAVQSILLCETVFALPNEDRYAGSSGGISPDKAVQAAESALKDASPVVASVTYAALTYMWATSAASLNKDTTGTQNAYNAASSVLSNFDSSVPVSLQTATAGMSRAVAQLTTETAQNKAAVANAVLQSIAAMEGCISVARLQGMRLGRLQSLPPGLGLAELSLWYLQVISHWSRTTAKPLRKPPTACS